MRLVGFSYCAEQDTIGAALDFEGGQHWRGPLGLGYLPIDELTALVGPNDSGKSQLLSLLSGSLGGHGGFGEGEGAGLSGAHSVLFASCSPGEFEVLTEHLIGDLLDPEDAPTAWGSALPTPGLRTSSWHDAFITAASLDDVELHADHDPRGVWSNDPIGAWADILAARATSDRAAWRDVVDAATEAARAGLGRISAARMEFRTPLIALERDGAAEGGQAWNLFWCLPPFDQLPGEVQQALQTSGLRADETDLLWPWGSETRERFPNHEWRRLRAAPVIVAPLGRTTLPIAPSALMLPLDFASARTEIEAGLTRALEQIRTADALVRFGLDAWAIDEDTGVSPMPMTPDEAWVEDEGDVGGSWKIPDYASDALEVVRRIAQALLPSPVAERYRLRLDITPPTNWAVDGKIKILLRDSAALESSWFPIDRAAAGHHLWLQLALLEATAEMERNVAVLGIWTSRLQDALEVNEEESLEGSSLLDDARDQCRQALHAFRNAGPKSLRPSGGDVDLRMIPGRNDSIDGMAQIARLLHGRLFVIDEPERNLHARRQRELARWLADLVRRSRTQAVIATHSAAFMGITEGASYTYLVREPRSPTLLRQFTPRDMTQLSDAAAELGLNRGELMTFVNVFLWVEGPMDYQVITNLFPEQLRDYGIEVAYLSGHSRATALLDAALLRFTEAKIAVWLDDTGTEFLARLRQDPSDAMRSATEEQRPERITLARLALMARDEGKEIHPVAQPGGDVFDLLDDEVIRESDMYPSYPGHVAARELWDQAQAEGWRKSERKNFWSQKLGTPISVESCIRIARRMREEGRVTDGLGDMIEACERLSLELG